MQLYDVCLQNPVPHKWGKAVTTSRRFCNVCRRKADPSVLLSCQGVHLLQQSTCCICMYVQCAIIIHTKIARCLPWSTARQRHYTLTTKRCGHLLTCVCLAMTAVSDFIATHTPLDWRKPAQGKVWGVHEVNHKRSMSPWTEMHLVWNYGKDKVVADLF